MNSDRKLLATIRVYEGKEQNPSHSRQVGFNEWEVTLNPKYDGQILTYAGAEGATKNPLKQNETILSHELGHVVAQIFRDPTHSPGLPFVAHMTGATELLLPGEKQAWVNAKEIYPEGDKEIKKIALESYEG